IYADLAHDFGVLFREPLGCGGVDEVRHRQPQALELLTEPVGFGAQALDPFGQCRYFGDGRFLLFALQLRDAPAGVLLVGSGLLGFGLHSPRPRFEIDQGVQVDVGPAPLERLADYVRVLTEDAGVDHGSAMLPTGRRRAVSRPRWCRW